MIKKIEGLDSLVHLEDLSLYHNEIEELEGKLDAQMKCLKSLSLAKNKIKDKKCVRCCNSPIHALQVPYLRKFKNLGMLTVYDNPVCDDRSFRLMVLAYLRQLKFLDYRMTLPDELQTAKERFHSDLLQVVDEEQKVSKDAELEQLKKEEQDMLSVCSDHIVISHTNSVPI